MGLWSGLGLGLVTCSVIPGDEHIGRLEVAVQDARGVHVLERGHELLEVGDRVRVRVRLGLGLGVGIGLGLGLEATRHQ